MTTPETPAEVLATELRALYKHYVNTLEAARDQIISRGGECDPLDVMEARDPVLKRVRDVLESARLSRSLAAGKVAPAVWMLRDSRSKEIWLDEVCVWTNLAEAQDCADDMNANIETASFEVFALYTAPPADPGKATNPELVLQLLIAGGFVDAWKVEQAREIIAGCEPAKASEPDDCAEHDAAMWELIRIAEECGAVKDSDDNSTWWTLDPNAFYALEARMRAALSAMRYAEAIPAAKASGSEPEYDRSLIADMLEDCHMRGHVIHEDAVEEQIRLLRAADNADAAKVRTVRGSGSAPWPVADEAARKDGWTWDYDWLKSLHHAAYAAGWTTTMEGIDFVLSKIATPPASAPEVTEFPKKVTKTVCDGCPNLRTERWKEHLDNDETDSGTTALCAKAGRSISTYWNKDQETPAWCPLTAALQEGKSHG